MSLVRLLLSAEAASRQCAVRATAFRHRHITDAPLVVTAFNLSGEAAAPLAFCYGTSAESPKVLVAPEPRNREARFAVINDFASDLCEYLKPHLAVEYRKNAKGKSYPVASGTPQIVTPNRATRAYVGERIGRSLRYLGLGTTHPVPETTVWAGSHLSWFADHARHPGQSSFLAATEILADLFATGQSDLENESLAAMLAWIENAPGSGLSSIRNAESLAFGPVPRPELEVAIEPLVHAWTKESREGNSSAAASLAVRIEKLVRDAIVLGYAATHRAVVISRAVPAAPSVGSRWQTTDANAWTWHAVRASKGIPRFTTRHGAIHAARMLETWSAALERMTFEEAIDDPMKLADHDAEGRCVVGSVIALDVENREIRPGNVKKTRVPVVTVKLAGPTRLLEGDEVVWTGSSGVSATIDAIDLGRGVATLKLTAGHKQGTVVPRRGDDVAFAAISFFGGLGPSSPDEVPWTHRAPDDDESGREGARRLAEDGSPDLDMAELAALPVVGAVPVDEVPGVVS